ncbi:MAG: hypothetical protein M1828_001281 [Chrysothrix sp. TS-e1954]|nr:MAG: hypothetical protein M1828_001281 [Chrysothrix sp. TS-e1954]
MPPPPQRGPARIDRQQITPSLVRLFYKVDNFFRPDEFLNPTSLPPHLEIYTWPDCSLRELTQIITTQLSKLKTAQPDLGVPSSFTNNPAGTRVAFRLIFPDVQAPPSQARPPRYLTRELGSVVVGEKEQSLADDLEGVEGRTLEGEGSKTLRDARFVIGDYVACAICLPLQDGSVARVPGAPAANGPRMGSSYPPRGPPPRENGYGSYGPRGGGGRGGFRSDHMLSRNGYGPPLEEWRRGERLPMGQGGGGYGRGRGRGRAW